MIHEMFVISHFRLQLQEAMYGKYYSTFSWWKTKTTYKYQHNGLLFCELWPAVRGAESWQDVSPEAGWDSEEDTEGPPELEVEQVELGGVWYWPGGLAFLHRPLCQCVGYGKRNLQHKHSCGATSQDSDMLKMNDSFSHSEYKLANQWLFDINHILSRQGNEEKTPSLFHNLI